MAKKQHPFALESLIRGGNPGFDHSKMVAVVESAVFGCKVLPFQFQVCTAVAFEEPVLAGDHWINLMQALASGAFTELAHGLNLAPFLI